MSGEAIVDFPIDDLTFYEVEEFDIVIRQLFNRQLTLGQVNATPGLLQWQTRIDNEDNYQYEMDDAVYANLFGVPVPLNINAGGGGTTYTLTVGGSYTFSGAVPQIRERKQVTGGSIVFSGAVPQLRTRTQNVSGGMVLSGAANYQRVKQYTPSGSIVFSGTAPLSAGGTASYVLTAGGAYTFSGVVAQLHTRTQTPSGGVMFSGAAQPLHQKQYNPTGLITYLGTVSQVHNKITIPGGIVQFSSTAPMSFVSGGVISGAGISRLNVKASKAMGL